MSERQNEKLSALLDDETSALELRQLLKDDAIDLQRLRRYQIARDAMHNHTPEHSVLPAAGIDISQSIAQAISDEQTYKQRTTLPWIGGAVAAGLAVVAISLSVFNPSTNSIDSLAQTAPQAASQLDSLLAIQSDASASLAVLNLQDTANAQTVEYIPADDNMEFYLAAHSNHSSLSQPQTLGYARLASYSSH